MSWERNPAFRFSPLVFVNCYFSLNCIFVKDLSATIWPTLIGLHFEHVFMYCGREIHVDLFYFFSLLFSAYLHIGTVVSSIYQLLLKPRFSNVVFNTWCMVELLCQRSGTTIWATGFKFGIQLQYDLACSGREIHVSLFYVFFLYLSIFIYLHITYIAFSIISQQLFTNRHLISNWIRSLYMTFFSFFTEMKRHNSQNY